MAISRKDARFNEQFTKTVGLLFDFINDRNADLRLISEQTLDSILRVTHLAILYLLTHLLDLCCLAFVMHLLRQFITYSLCWLKNASLLRLHCRPRCFSLPDFIRSILMFLGKIAVKALGKLVLRSKGIVSNLGEPEEETELLNIRR